MIVEVRQEHIDEGTQGCPCYCAVSLAVNEALMHKYKFTEHTLETNASINLSLNLSS